MRRMAAASEAENVASAKTISAMLRSLNELPKPTIARVNGAVYAAGTGLVTACDIAVAVEQAVFSISEVRIGLTPSTISPHVVAAIGARAARRYFLTGEPFSAADASRLGLVHQVVAESALDGAVESLIATLLAGGPQSQSRAKRLIADVAGRPVDDALEMLTARSIADARASPEGGREFRRFLTSESPPGAEVSRRRYPERLGAGEKPRPGAMRQGDSFPHALTQDAIAAFPWKINALDAVSRRKRGDKACQAIRFAQYALAIAERRQIDGNGNAIEIWRIELASGSKRRRDDRILDHEAAETLDHKRETGAFRAAERQQRRELFRIGRVASVCVESPAERDLLSRIPRAHHLAHGNRGGGHVQQQRRPVRRRKRDRQRIGRDA